MGATANDRTGEGGTIWRVALLALPLVFATGCDAPEADAARAASETEEVVVEHVLVSFRGAIGFGRGLPPRARHRSEEEARDLAARLELLLRNREPMARLVLHHSDDPIGQADEATLRTACGDGCGRDPERPGAYRLRPPRPLAAGWTEGLSPAKRREVTLVRALHESLHRAGSRLAPGEIRLFPYDARDFPLGHHLVRRLR